MERIYLSVRKRRLVPNLPADSLTCDAALDGHWFGSFAIATAGEFLRAYVVEMHGNGLKRCIISVVD